MDSSSENGETSVELESNDSEEQNLQNLDAICKVETFNCEETEETSENIDLSTVKEEPETDPLNNEDPDLHLKHDEGVAIESQFIKMEAENDECAKEHPSKNNLKRYTCSVCDRTFSRPQHLKFHKKVHEKRFQCRICSKRLKWEGDYKRHVKRHTKEAPLKCNICDKRFFYELKLKQHLLVHTGAKPFQCPDCNTKFRWSRNFRDHLKVKETSEYKCKYCEKKFPRTSCLKSHTLNQHTTNKPHTCDICSKTFRNAYGLDQHATSHTDERPYQCDLCHKKFRQKGLLTAHLKRHSAHKPFKCTLCDAAFRQNGLLRRHLVTHDHKFKCEYCGLEFRKEEKLLDHHRKVQYFLECKTCQGKFCSMSSLKRHQCATGNGKNEQVEEVIVKVEKTIKEEVDECLTAAE